MHRNGSRIRKLLMKMNHQYCTCLKFIQKCGPRTMIKLLLLTVGACTMYMFTTTFSASQPNTAVDRLGPAFALIQGGKNSHLDYLKGFSETSDDDKIVLMNRMREALTSLLEKCTRNGTVCKRRYKSHSILTLFTTWVYEKEKFSVNNNTLFNWKMLPNVNLIVFSNSKEVKYYSKRAGFTVLPIMVVAEGVPVLPAMFTAATNQFKSEFYGFANGDILFTRTLVDTLEHILCNLEESSRRRGVLIVGRRYNVPASRVTDEVATSWNRLDRLSRTSSLFQADAEDYFITDKAYPWDTFLPVAIGRRAYDNWVVAFSRYSNITVIDASESILCLHQTLESRGNFEGLGKGRYNIDLIHKLDVPYSLYGWGRTLCAGLKSWVNLCGEIVLSKRYKIEKQCTSYYTSFRIYRMLGLR